MTKRVVSVLLLIAFIPYVSGCVVRTQKQIPREMPANPKDKIVAVIYLDGRVLKFGKDGGWYVPDGTEVRGLDQGGSLVTIPIDSLSAVRVERVEGELTFLANVGIVLLVIVVIAGIAAAGSTTTASSSSESCPFVYSYDGTTHLLDAEPLGGAVCRGLARVDHSRLEHLRPSDGIYRLVVRNEVEETQHIDEMKLLVFDDEPNRTILPDYFGNFHAIDSVITPLRAVDENGADLTRFVGSSDGVAWQSILPTNDSFKAERLRHELTFEFQKPSGPGRTALVVNAGTAIWGSKMIREMLRLRGNRVDDWYKSIEAGGEAYREFLEFSEREEMYLLKVWVREGDEWKLRGWIHGGGPFVTEDVAIPMDLGGVQGETVAVRVSPPRGFWTIDYVALGRVAEGPDRPVEAPLLTAVGDDGASVKELLRERDGREYVMPRVGDTAKLEFAVPPQRKGSMRSVFLETGGFYEIHLDKTQPEQTALIQEALRSDSMAVEYALDQHVKLYREFIASGAPSDSAR